MRKILVINGANLNMLGVREREIYGEKSYRELVRYIKRAAKERGLKVKVKQTNYEGKIVDLIQKAKGRYYGIIINAGGYTHTSVVIADALRAVAMPAAEVHLSDIYSREDYRKTDYITDCVCVSVVGKGFYGYALALDALATGNCV